MVGLFGALAAVCLLEGQTAPLSPPKQRIAKPGSGQDGKSHAGPQDDKPAAQNAVSTPAQPSPPTCDEACQQGRKNLAIQGKLEWFTGALAIVGVLQVITMAWQAWLLKQTRGDVHEQAEWMRTQAGHMKNQTKILSDSVAAAQNSANAAMAQVQMMVAKERASIEITFAEDSDAMVVRPDEMVRVGSFHLNLKNVGGTAAKNVTGWYDTFASEEEKAPKIQDKFWLAPPATVEGNAWEPIPAPLSIDPRFTADRAPELFYVYLRGEITYNDIFKKEPNFTRFLLRRQFIRGGIGEAISREFWGPAGEGENEST